MVEQMEKSDEGFALRVSPTPRGQFSVAVYPEIPELAPQVEVSTSKFRQFLLKYSHQVQLKRVTGSLDLFVSAVTEDKVRELIGASPRLMNPERSPLAA
jgi:hypothetical protein